MQTETKLQSSCAVQWMFELNQDEFVGTWQWRNVALKKIFQQKQAEQKWQGNYILMALCLYIAV